MAGHTVNVVELVEKLVGLTSEDLKGWPPSAFIVIRSLRDRVEVMAENAGWEPWEDLGLTFHKSPDDHVDLDTMVDAANALGKRCERLEAELGAERNEVQSLKDHRANWKGSCEIERARVVELKDELEQTRADVDRWVLKYESAWAALDDMFHLAGGEGVVGSLHRAIDSVRDLKAKHLRQTGRMVHKDFHNKIVRELERQALERETLLTLTQEAADKAESRVIELVTRVQTLQRKLQGSIQRDEVRAALKAERDRGGSLKAHRIALERVAKRLGVFWLEENPWPSPWVSYDHSAGWLVTWGAHQLSLKEPDPTVGIGFHVDGDVARFYADGMLVASLTWQGEKDDDI